MRPSISVLGSGHSGHALAGVFASKGYDVTLVSLRRAYQGLVELVEHNRILLTYKGQKQCIPVRFSNDLSKAMQADIVMCSTPATHHADVVKRILPYVRDGQYLYFSSYFGALRMLHALKARPELKGVTVVESMSAMHAARSLVYGEVEILAQKDKVPVSAYPSYKVGEFIKLVSKALPSLVAFPSILSTSLNNVGPILHVPLMVFNAGRIEFEANPNWNLYREGLTDSVKQVIQSLDKERMAIARKFDIPVCSLEESMLEIYYHKEKEKDFWTWIRNNDIHAHKTIGAPDSINTRYLTEGVYFGLYPMTRVAREVGVPTLLMNALIKMADHLLGKYRPQVETPKYITPQMLGLAREIARAA